MNLVALLFLFAGIVLILANELVVAQQKPTVRYMYLPRDLDTYMREEPYASVTFHSMFKDENVQYPRAALQTTPAPLPPPTLAPASLLGPPLAPT
jgi:hypothetical protein